MTFNGMNGYNSSYQNNETNEHSHLQIIVEGIIQTSSDAVCLFNEKGQAVSMSASFRLLMGLQDEGRASSSSNLLPIFETFDVQKAQDGKLQRSQSKLPLPNGKAVEAEILHLPYVRNNVVKGSYCRVNPRTDKNHLGTEQDLLTYMQTIFSRLDIAIWSANLEENKLLCVSSAIQDIYEMPLDEVRLDTWKSLVHPDDLEAVIKAKRRLSTDGKIVHTYRIITSKNKIKWIYDHTITIKDSRKNFTQVLGCLEDITTLRELQQQVQEMNYIDSLTQLPNRYYGRALLKNLIAKSEKNKSSFALFYLNLKGFNRINETFGHDVGDEVMKQTAYRIRHFIKDCGHVCRVSGNQFIATLEFFNDMRSLYKLAQSLINIIEAPLTISDYTIYVSAMIGISLFPNDGCDTKELVKASRAALARAKQMGDGNIQVYSSSMNIESFKALQLDSDLRRAVENNEFYLMYQPKISFKTQKALGAEALIRWKHPIWGIVSPAEFIAVAEASSCIQQIGDFVMETVCRQAGEWRQQGVAFQQLAFNLSPKNLYKNDLVDRLEGYINKYGADATKLEIEITEGALLRQTADIQKQISRIKKLGVGISLDDYGTGYSSIHYLKHYPVDTIKIDRSYIQNLANDRGDRVIVKSIVDLGNGLNKRVIAEGVETLEQFHILKEMGCDEAQGYLFSRPVSPAEMKHLFLLDKVEPKQQDKAMFAERRQYERVRFKHPLRSQMTILSIKKKQVQVGSTEVLIEGVGLGGLRMISHLRLEPESDILYGFQLHLMDTVLELKGKMKWAEEIREDIFDYGVELLVNNSERAHLSRLLDGLSIQLKANPFSYEEQFITEDPIDYFKGKK